MLIIVLALAFAAALAIFRRDTGLGRELHRILVETPAAALNRGPIAAAAHIAAFTMVLGFAVVAPELISLAGAIDFALFLELGGLLLATRVSGWLRVGSSLAAKAFKPIFGPFRRKKFSGTQARPRARRIRSVGKPSAKGDDEDAEWPFVFA